MKKFCLFVVIALSLMAPVLAQTDVKISRPEFSQSPTAKYRLFPTQNIWTFIKLDTSNGKLWVVQFSMNHENRFEVPLSTTPRCSTDGAKNGRFTLYSTSNIYTFIMLDQTSGKLWQVQWGNRNEDLMVMNIN